jgi:hypothetical protein
MSSTQSVMIPDGYSPEFARALNEFRNGNFSSSVFSEIRNRYGTERYFLEALEEIFSHNGWKLDIKTKRNLKKLFKDGTF